MRHDGIVFTDHAKLRIGRRVWELGTAPLRKFQMRGLCCTPKRRGDPAMIMVSTHLRPGTPMHIEAVLHETLHAIMPDLGEKQAEQTAHLLAEALRKYGYASTTRAPTNTYASRSGLNS